MKFACGNLLIILVICLLAACKSGPQDIKYGVESCYYCKMSIVDNRFAVQMVNNNRRAYNFDDIYCCREILKDGGLKMENIAAIYINDYSQPGKLIPKESVLLLFSKQLRTPMGGNVAAFEYKDSLSLVLAESEGKQITWDEAMAGEE
jgi:copper chaperone NosL